ncbi:hypothetical protein GCM10020331_024940 [Ectobacillus funiculus]
MTAIKKSIGGSDIETRKAKKILGYSLLAVVIIAAGAIAYAYKQLQPQKSF